MSPAVPDMAIVAGMHRAGTSAIARGLAVLGFDLGPRLMSADVRMNARGFFEDVDIVALDDTAWQWITAGPRYIASVAHYDADMRLSPNISGAVEMTGLADDPLFPFPEASLGGCCGDRWRDLDPGLWGDRRDSDWGGADLHRGVVPE